MLWLFGCVEHDDCENTELSQAAATWVTQLIHLVPKETVRYRVKEQGKHQGL